MNSVELLGNLARDVEISSTKTGKNVARFTVVTNEQYVVNGETKNLVTYVNCVAWNNLADAIANYTKGQRVFAHGRIATRSYDAKDGTKRYATEVICDIVARNDEAGATQSSNFDYMGTNSASTQEEIPF